MSLKSRLLILGVIVVVIGIVLVATRPGRDSGEIKAAFGAEFLTRPDGYKGLSKHYGFEFSSEPLQMDEGLMYRAVADSAVDVIDGFSTDGRIPAYNLKMLEDDRGFFPPYYAAPLIRVETLEKYPELEEILGRIGDRISNEVMQKLNYEVDEKGRQAAEVAREFLKGQGLIPAASSPGENLKGKVMVGGKNFTEQEILGEIIASLIELNSSLEVVRKLNLGSTMICFNALKAGDLDLYAEYTGTGLVNILKREVISDPERAYETVQQAFRTEYNLAWLKPFGFNNTYTLTMRQSQAEELGIKTISDLANHINQNRSE